MPIDQEGDTTSASRGDGTRQEAFMAKIKLTYFDFHGGRGEAARLAFSIGGVAYEDDRIPMADWPAMKESTPFGAMPILEVDGQIVTQSNGINRYVGKLTGLYPSDPWQAALCDEAMDVVEESTGKTVATFGLPPEEMKTAREALVDGPLTFYLTRMQQRLEAHGGTWFAGDRLSVADLKVFIWIEQLKSGRLDHVPRDLPDRVAPKLVELCERVRNEPGVKAHYAKHGRAA
jgi:glutathione S-transferase